MIFLYIIIVIVACFSYGPWEVWPQISSKINIADIMAPAVHVIVSP